MNILLRLSARHLRLNRKRTLITILGIALSVAMVTAISGFIVSFQDLLYQDSVAQEGLWHVRYAGLDTETMQRVAKEPVFSGYTITEGEEGATLDLLFTDLDRHIFDRSEAVCERYGIKKEQVRYHNNLLIAKGIIPAGYYESLYAFAAILLFLVAIASVMVISNAFSISAAERSRQFGLLQSVGATRKQVRRIVLWEGFLLGACAIPLGILVGLLAQWVALSAANYILGSMDVVTFQAQFRVVLSGWVLLIAVGAAFLTIFLAAWLPARRAARQNAIDAIRQAEDVSIRPRDVRIPRLTGKLFGFEGLLAAKTMRRSRRRYRTTVISLVVSIVLFIGVSSFGEMLFKASSMVYENYGSNVFFSLYSGSAGEQDSLVDEMAGWEGVTLYPYRVLRGGVQLGEDLMTETGLEILGLEEKTLNLYGFSPSSFSSFCEALRLDESAFESLEHPAAILVNTSGTYIRQGRRHNFTPYRIAPGETLRMEREDGPILLTVLGQTDRIPAEIAAQFYANSVSLIAPEHVVKALLPEGTSDLNVTAMALDADSFEERAAALLEEAFPEGGFYLINYEALAANNRNIWLLIMIFVYGFIAMLTLISVTNVITTISTGIALRKRELATLRSMGMTRKSIAKSLRYESLIYGLKSLLLGIPLGIGVSLLMYHALDGSMSFEYIWPLQSIFISIAAVFLLTVATMSFSGSRQRHRNIADTLQSEIL